MKPESSSIGEHASEAVDRFADAATSVAGNVSDQAAKALSRAGVEGDNLKSALGNVLESAGAEVRGIIRDKPMGALAAAAAFGLVVGLATRR